MNKEKSTNAHMNKEKSTKANKERANKNNERNNKNKERANKNKERANKNKERANKRNSNVMQAGRTVALKGGRTHRWCADEGNRVICNRGHIAQWEKFYLGNGGGGR